MTNEDLNESIRLLAEFSKIEGEIFKMVVKYDTDSWHDTTTFNKRLEDAVKYYLLKNAIENAQQVIRES